MKKTGLNISGNGSRFKWNVLDIVNVIMIVYVVKQAFFFLRDIGTTFRMTDDFFWTEFLINYQGGYVRRGMLGEILYAVVVSTGINVQWLIVAISVLSAVGFWCFFIYNVWKKGVRWWILPLNFTLLGADFIRKDNLCMLCVIGVIYLLKCANWNKWVRFGLLNILSIILWNLHEAFFFVIGPFMLYYVLCCDYSFNQIWHRFAAVVPSMLAAVVVFCFNGNKEIAIVIQQSWHELYPNIFRQVDIFEPFGLWEGHSTSITALGWDTVKTIKTHLYVVYGSRTPSVSDQPYGICVWPFVYMAIIWFVSRFVFVFAKDNSEFKGKSCHTFMLVLVFQFFAMLPMFFGLSCDMGRICMYWTATSLAILLILGHNAIETMFPICVYDFSKQVNDKLDKLIPRRIPLLLVCVLFMGVRPVGYYIYDFNIYSVMGSIVSVAVNWLIIHC